MAQGKVFEKHTRRQNATAWVVLNLDHMVSVKHMHLI